MIFFLCTRPNRFPMDRYLASWGRPFRHLIQPITYKKFLAIKDPCPGIYIFADLELLTPIERAQALQQWERLSAMGKKVLLINHPQRSLSRYDLLKTLRAQNINDFTVYRTGENLSQLRFPAFLRIENDHSDERSAIVSNHQELDAALAQIKQSAQANVSWLITEFYNIVDSEGIYRKYSAFLINGQILPRHIFFSREWCQKSDDLLDEKFLKEEREYLRTNPHAKEIKKIFELASIEYGRIDYGWKNGKIHVWEINTNPMILTFKSYQQLSRLPIHKDFGHRLAENWRQLAETAPGRNRQGYPEEQFRATLFRAHEWLQGSDLTSKTYHKIFKIKHRLSQLLRRQISL